ncbi:uncharacterized protein LOC111874824 [Cryptotermes secundus]|uniref:uncharacterized protein LOC111874824 n=1 Tax=Cryptotermes secundus TaxID=105785 RepID=UPI000CD7AE6A|nr:uncharacterized protein LOC111874824 [Cryptotermes secundus]XP_023726417.1 uncharacterized protein LOC111874824 [Cryptotermes secundus]XP_023726418.1 uncharacterized protein LOC111874824 [Cryptotermes secundus]XP_023726419.1 uncharacterized protein LOC111874824 [Cryptotermes secundus]XP_023726420.1 uncharacterized protein LOC111874824 [Cryptotermes secundus]XP_023726421.1 uncharacterized protein LOC111874824 [Cryptotermes secundus]XP_023726422.1 uncharacterized protein LOC111874824 [Crypto
MQGALNKREGSESHQSQCTREDMCAVPCLLLEVQLQFCSWVMVERVCVSALRPATHQHDTSSDSSVIRRRSCCCTVITSKIQHFSDVHYAVLSSMHDRKILLQYYRKKCQFDVCDHVRLIRICPTNCLSCFTMFACRRVTHMHDIIRLCILL